MKKLVELFDKYKCDKGSLRHRYDRVYEPTLEHLRDKEFNMLEIGIFKGNSTEAWREYFPKANFYGIDIFTRLNPEEIPVLNKSRVKWCKCDSIKGPNDDFKKMVGDIKFDVIIDDGLHTHDAQKKTFENFIPYLSSNGIYFIEDVWAFNYMNEKQKQHPWITSHKIELTETKYNNLLKTLKPFNTIFHDLRNNFYNDTFIIEIKNDI